MKEKIREAGNNLLVVVIAVIIGLFFRNYCFEVRIVPTESMAPTIESGQFVLLNKFVYFFKEPEREDIVLFSPPKGEPTLSDDVDIIKRAIGLPEDTIEIKDSHLYVNEKKYEEGYIKEPMLANFDFVTVPEEKLFIMGDNRNRSGDNRNWQNTFIPVESVKGKVIGVFDIPYMRDVACRVYHN